MGLFRKIYNQKVIFSEKSNRNYKLLLSLESINNDYIITYVDDKINKRNVISKNNLNKYVFLERTKNKFYKKYNKIDPLTLVKEMDTGDVGIGGTADSTFSGDFYAPDDARNIFGGNKKPPIVKRPDITDQITKKKKKKKNGKEKK
jgi:hypothetical protein